MDEKPYRDLNTYYRNLFGGKTAKISLDGGFTCPNRDGTIGTGGCLFCSAGGSGDFAESAALSIKEQIAKGKSQTSAKWEHPRYITYFQAFTNTYAPVDTLRQKYEEALSQPDIVGLSIATPGLSGRRCGGTAGGTERQNKTLGGIGTANSKRNICPFHPAGI